MCRLLLLGRKNAHERVATFLLDVASRISADETIDLRMSRHDIADDLGLTDGLANTQLEGTAVIALPTSRRILLRNRAALRRLNS